MRSKTNTDFISADGENYYVKYPLQQIDKKLPLKTLSAADFEHWQKYGYVIVKNAISRKKARALFDASCQFQGIDSKKPDTWYSEKTFATELEEHLYIYGFVEMYQHQLLWDIRQDERIYNAFVDIWDTESLWTTLDRINLNPPNRENRSRVKIPKTEQGFDINLHWDVDTKSALKPQRVQGIVALTDSDDSSGGFQCCPRLFNEYQQWLTSQPDDRDPIRPNIDSDEYPIVQPKLAAGDLLIFNGWLAHGVKENSSKDKIRSVFYLSMMPAIYEQQQLTKSRIDSWQHLTTPCWNKTLIGDQTKHEKLRYGPATLTPLGQKLLGQVSWFEEEKHQEKCPKGGKHE
ncbi:phytanoyl-CoA dioxygenase family protein [Paraglaciecola sp.]|uniref:phytanoyl-CoA dioxygenase family protein n=1 Tax=Paraglaciecola sp. TaxID=1920173 RepID=UPI0030F440C5